MGSSSSMCLQDVACYSRSNACGMKIWCAGGIDSCKYLPECMPGYRQLDIATCPKVPVPADAGTTSCHTVTVCGRTIACMQLPDLCTGPRPVCNPGDTEVASPSLCPADAACYSRSDACNGTIWCWGAVDGGV